MFQRGPDQIPRGNGTLRLRIVFHDFRERIYNSLGKLVDKPKGALAFMDRCIDRTDGRPGRKEQPVARHQTKFVLTTKDGQETELFTPETQRAAAAPAGPKPMPAEDAIIMGGPVGKLLRV